jgi:hypothetical protein
MAAPDDDVDPRFDPRFQRGYDPARHAGADPARVRNSGDRASGIDTGTPPPADVLNNERAGDDTDGQDAAAAATPSAPPSTRRITIAGIALILVAALLIAAAIVIVQITTAAEAAGQALIARPDRFPDILLGTAPAPLAAVGCVAAVLGVALLLFAPPRRTPEELREDAEGTDDGAA